MSAGIEQDARLEIAHVLCADIVGYSKLLVDQQSEYLRQLNGIVRQTEQFCAAETADKLLRLPTGDGMALAFFSSPDAPVRCAIEIARKLKEYPHLKLRMGIHSGPVDPVMDVNDRSNVAGAGINMAQRVMDCGDAGHILLSSRLADDLAQYSKWQPHLHDLGEAEVKHGVRLGVVNFYGDDFGNKNTPEKLTRAQREHEDLVRAVASSTKRKRNLRFVGAAILALILLGIGFWISQRVPRRPTASPIPEKSIAVLPFDNFGDEKENGYFADGVQDDILTDLAKVSDLKVISRKSVAQFRGSTKSAREIGQALGVGHLLEGSVRKAAGRIRITVQLIDTRTDQHLWAETYDRELADVFAIQSELAQKIASALKAALSPAEKAAIEAQPTKDLEAYDLYLQARSLVYAFGLLSKTRDENLPKAEKLLETAIARDPKFVLAYCLLGEVQRTPPWAVNVTAEQLSKSRASIETALRIAPESGEAHLALAWYYYDELGGRDLPIENEVRTSLKKAEDELAITAQKIPNNVDAIALAANIAHDRGEWAKALHNWEKAAELDPRDPDVAKVLAYFYIDLRRYADAESLINRTIPTLPVQVAGVFWRLKSWIALCQGDTKTAMANLDAGPQRNAGLPGFTSELAHVFLLQRKYDEAAKLMESIEEIARAHGVLPESGINHFAQGHYLEILGTIRRAQGQTEKAMAAFEASRKQFEQWLEQRHDEPLALAYRAVDAAGLGRKDDALREVRDVLDKWPASRNPSRAIEVATQAALAYAWIGEGDSAIQQLEAVVKQPGGPDAGDLKLNPQWDDLRNDPRFDKIVAEAAKPVLLD